MEIFVAVAENVSFVKAARTLNMSPAAVTRAIAALESRLSTALFVRTTRTVRLTEAGQRFWLDCRRILSEVLEAEEAAAGLHAAPRGVVTVTAPVLFGGIYVSPILRAFIDTYPNVQANAFFVDRVVNMLDEGVDVAIRIGELPDSSLTAIRVGQVRRVLFGAPSYFTAYGYPQHPNDLIAHRLVSPRVAAPVNDLDFRDGPETIKLTVKPLMTINSLDAVIETTLSGWALARALSYQIAPHVEAGRLQTILREYEPPPLPVHVVHPEGRRASAKIRAFVDFAVERLRTHPLLDRPHDVRIK